MLNAISSSSPSAGYGEKRVSKPKGLPAASLFERTCSLMVWRNCEILAAKYDNLKLAFTFMALALMPWMATLAIFSFAKQGLYDLEADLPSGATTEPASWFTAG